MENPQARVEKVSFSCCLILARTLRKATTLLQVTMVPLLKYAWTCSARIPSRILQHSFDRSIVEARHVWIYLQACWPRRRHPASHEHDGAVLPVRTCSQQPRVDDIDGPRDVLATGRMLWHSQGRCRRLGHCCVLRTSTAPSKLVALRHCWSNVRGQNGRSDNSYCVSAPSRDVAESDIVLTSATQ